MGWQTYVRVQLPFTIWRCQAAWLAWRERGVKYGCNALSLSHAHACKLRLALTPGARAFTLFYWCVASLCCHLACARSPLCLPVISCFMLFRVKSVCVAGVANTHTHPHAHPLRASAIRPAAPSPPPTRTRTLMHWAHARYTRCV